MPIFCLQGLCRVNQYHPFGHPVRPRTGCQYWFFKLLLWHYLPAYFYPDSLGTVPQSRMNLVPSSLMRSLKPCPSPSFTTWRISQLTTSNRYAKTGFLFCSWQIGNFPQKDIAKRGNTPSLTGFHHSPISYPECFRGEITLRVFFVATFSNCSSTKFKSCVSR